MRTWAVCALRCQLGALLFGAPGCGPDWDSLLGLTHTDGGVQNDVDARVTTQDSSDLIGFTMPVGDDDATVAAPSDAGVAPDAGDGGNPPRPREAR